MLNPFESDDAFSMASLSAAIDILPNRYGRINELGLFVADAITQRTAIIEERNGILNILKTQPVGAPAPQNKVGKRTARSFVVPHIPLDDVIRPDEYAGIRAFGQPAGLETLVSVMNNHLQTGRDKFDLTLEYLRMGALKGIILDADTTELYNLYTEFGIVAKTVAFVLGTASTNVLAKCREVKRHIEDNLKGERMTGVRALVDADFFDALVGHANVEKFWLNHQAALNYAASDQDPRKGFNFGGITWEEYRGTGTDEDGNTRKFITADEGHCFPMGTANTFKTIYAPGNFLEAVNTPGIPIYVKQAMEAMGRWIDIHFESNPLP
ncbi:MAG: major capsid protein, partial [Candidatus Omnitrophota bacterium]|nr:major capsid protein [Candidatus Omnitrophota bacterium]